MASDKLLRIPKWSTQLVCGSVREFAGRMNKGDRIIGVQVTDTMVNLAISNKERDFASVFGLMGRVNVTQDRASILDALKYARRRTKDVAVGGFVLLERQRKPGDEISEKSKGIHKYVKELFARQDFPNLKGVLSIGDVDVAVRSFQSSQDWQRTIQDHSKRPAVERRAVHWDAGQPRVKRVTDRLLEKSTQAFAISARTALQVVLDAMRAEEHLVEAEEQQVAATETARVSEVRGS